MAVSFQVAKQTDRLVFDQALKGIGAAGLSVFKVQFHPMIGNSVDLSGEPIAITKPIEDIFSLNGELINSFNFFTRISKKLEFHVSVSRQPNKPFDSVSVNPQSQPETEQDRLVGLKVLGELRKALVAIDQSETVREALGEIKSQQYAAQETALSRLQSISETIVVKQEENRKTLEDDYQKRKDGLEADYEKRKKSLEEQEAAFKARLSAIDDRESKHVRREIRKSLKEEFKRRDKEFELSDGTQKLRRPVNYFIWVLLSILGAMLVYSFTISFGLIKVEITDMTAFYVRQAAVTIAFAFVSYFFLRWNTRYFEMHAKEEFGLKRLDIDLDRASWVAELFSESAKEKQELPPQLLERFTAGLFKNEDRPEPPLHPADHLMSEVFGASSEATIKLPGGSELKINRKGIKELSGTA